MKIDELITLYNKLSAAQRGALAFVLQLLNATITTEKTKNQ